MKKTLTIVKDWGTLVAFCTLIYIGMGIRDDIKELKAAAIENQKFQSNQDKINVKTGIVVDYVIGKIMDEEIEEDHQ